MTEFIDCGSLSISYDATGKASVSFTVVKDTSGELIREYDVNYWGGQKFDCILTNVSQKPIVGSRTWYEWGLQMEGVAD